MQTSRECTLSIKPAFCFVAAISLLIFPLRWLACWFVAAVLHELCHSLALLLCRVRIYGITVDVTGAKIETGPLSTFKEMLCALAGPLGGLCLLLLSGTFPRLAVCALVQSAYNFIPLFPFDGGRVLSCLLISVLGQKKGQKWMKICETVFLYLLVVLACWAAFSLKLGVLPLTGAVLLILRSGKLKFPCKADKQIVQ